MEQEKVTSETKQETEGEALLQEYFRQDKDDKHYMGHAVHTKDGGDGSCCC